MSKSPHPASGAPEDAETEDLEQPDIIYDSEGYRPGVGIIIANRSGKVFWGRRIGTTNWQFPQGGINENESLVSTLHRELAEETGLQPHHVDILGQTSEWTRYELPALIKKENGAKGQKHIWFMLLLVAGEDAFDLAASPDPEFDEWQWIDYWDALDRVVEFKRPAYRQALTELERCLPKDGR